jgi:3,4-dihydroxy 2-butanone 4-phosphate synthase/GTP cyclohydrolase II
MLPAELASAETLGRLLSRTDTAPVIGTTRDRLEQMGVFTRPTGESGEDDNALNDPAQRNTAADERVPPAHVARAAACVAGRSGPDQAASALAGIDLRCVDWAGVVNCPRPVEAAVDLCRLAGLAPAAVLVRLPADSTDTGNGAAAEVSIAALAEFRKARARRHLPRSGPRTRLPTRYGNFNLQAYEDPLTGHLHIALWMGQLQGPVLTRIHSECLTGDLFGSLRCDCGNQLALALSNIAENGEGILLYLRQEGRGIGLVNKLRSYVLQDQGFDTVEANRQLGFGDDLRDYSAAGLMLKDLGVTSVRLLTNNPRKIRGLESCGIEVEARAPLVIEPCSDSKAYLEVKRIKLGHLLP